MIFRVIWNRSTGRNADIIDREMSLFFSISLVILGGDGSVINVINALLRYIAKENRIK